MALNFCIMIVDNYRHKPRDKQNYCQRVHAYCHWFLIEGVIVNIGCRSSVNLSYKQIYQSLKSYISNHLKITIKVLLQKKYA